MKEVITTVGTSIFINYQKQHNDIDDKIEDLKLKPYREWDNYQDDIRIIKETIQSGIKENSSAEIKSILKIQEELISKLNVILLTTDTILSNLSAKIIKKYFEDNDDILIREIIFIKDLQVENYNKFIKGKDNLIKEIRKIIKKEFDKENNNVKKTFKNITDNYIFNISGGYKVIISIVTIISQIYRIKTFYIFEESNDLIESALIPLGFDDFLLEKLYFSIDMLKHQNGYKEKDNNIINKLKSANFIRDNKVTELGELFYEYVYYNREISRSVLGYFAEYKLYEYFIKNKQYKCIEHSYTRDGKNELDFVLDNNIIVEVKPMIWFLYDDKVKNIINQIDKQIEQYPKYKEHYLYIYTSFKEIVSKHDKIKEHIEKLNAKLTKKHNNIKFKYFEIYWSLSQGDDNQYQTFIKHNLKNRDITEIELKGGKKDV